MKNSCGGGGGLHPKMYSHPCVISISLRFRLHKKSRTSPKASLVGRRGIGGMQCSASFGENFGRPKWWSSRVEPVLETAVIAERDIPPGVASLPFVSCLSLRKLLSPKPASSVLMANVSRMGTLSVDQHVDWIPMVSLATNCEEQNAEAQLSPFADAVVIQTTKLIRAGEELKVWLSAQLLAFLEIPFLKPINIVNHQVYKCSVCGLSFNQPNPLKVHIAFDCRQVSPPGLPSPSSSSSPLLNMFPVSELNVPLNPIMSSITSASNNSIIHHNQHQNENCIPFKSTSLATKEPRTHVCMFCGKLYTRKYGLKIHLRTHTGHKPLQCRFCGRPFSDPSNLNKHIRLHAHNSSSSCSSSPYKCKYCGKILVRRRDLERHLKSRHNKH